MAILGHFLFVAGVLIMAAGEAAVLAAAVRRGWLLFWSVMLVPAIWMVFAVANLRVIWRPLATIFIGVWIAWFGGVLADIEM